jgi:hypothetical protein
VELVERAGMELRILLRDRDWDKALLSAVIDVLVEDIICIAIVFVIRASADSKTRRLMETLMCVSKK